MTQTEFLSKLQRQYSENLPFAIYRSCDSSGTVKALLQEDSRLYKVEDFSESGFVFAPFDEEKVPLLIPGNASKKLIFEENEFSPASGEPEIAAGNTSEEAKHKHIALVAKAVEVLQQGEMKKVVLSRKEEVALTKEVPLNLFFDLLNSYPTAFVYCWYHPETGLWLGATPETLLKVEGNRFKSMALAGTQKFEGTVEVSWGEKEKQEQQFVTDSILENLQDTSAENIQSTRAYTVQAGNLLHLRTDIQGNFGRSPVSNTNSAANLKQVISALHPTPAVCGLPKELAKKFILEEEGYDREFYTGYLGELNIQQVTQRTQNKRNVENLAYRAVKKETSLFVNLRCMKIENDKAILFIGGGITKDSVPKDEWQETINKAETMKKVLFK
ncbi:chorismate-binding protein [Salinimicrobium sp. GXAS 041]|uniref:chorismate-binding protein n=1 Tax=Salinimicrobium sp. GXAS 041 TaxID=3400806 RepID=UPI003C7860B6